MSRALSLVGALGLAALLAAGCGSSSTSSTASPPAPATPAPTRAGSGAGASGSVQVKMANTQFSPQSSTVKVGQKVTWVNEDQFAHNVTATSGATFKSSDFGHGKSFSFKPTKPGTINYVCTIHSNMTATLTVTS